MGEGEDFGAKLGAMNDGSRKGDKVILRLLVVKSTLMTHLASKKLE